jgi:O-antigen ligase
MPAWMLPRRLAQWTFAIVVLAGAFSMKRFTGDDSGSLAVLLEPRITAAALLMGAALLVLLARSDSVRLTPSLWGWLLLFVLVHVFIAVTYFWSVDPWNAKDQLTDLLLLIVSTLLFMMLFGSQPELSTHMFAIAGLIISAPFLAATLMAGATSDEVFLLGGGGIGAARLYGIAAIGTTYFYMRRGHPALLLPLPVLFAGIMMSGSRAALLALVPALFMLYARRKSVRTEAKRSRFAHGIMLVVAFVAVIGFFLTPLGLQILTAFVISNFVEQSSSGAASSGIYLADRDAIFLLAWQRIVDDPILAMGIGSYRGPFNEPYPHNLFLMYGVDGGIIGLLASLFFAGWFTVLAATARLAWCVLAAAIGVFVLMASLFAGSYYDARLFWFMMLALLLAGHEREQPEMKAQRLLAVRSG